MEENKIHFYTEISTRTFRSDLRVLYPLIV